MQVRSEHLRRRADYEIHEVYHVGRVVVKAPATLRFFRAPRGTALGSNDHLTKCAACDVINIPQRAGAYKPLRFAERANKAIVIADLIDAAFGLRQRSECLAVRRIEREGLLDKYVQAALECLGRHVEVRRSG